MNSFVDRLRHVGLHRPRLVAAVVAGVLVWLALPAQWTSSSRGLVAWNVALWPYLASMAWLMLHSKPLQVKRIAEQEDASSAVILTVVCTAAVLSLFAIVAQLSQAKTGGHGAFLTYVLPLLTVMGSWLLLGIVYTFHYTHMFYESPEDARPLRFPDDLAAPSYHDFLYFSFTICATAQTSDVSVISTPMRVIVLGHSVLSFLFNVAILGLFINIAAGLISTF